MNSSPSFPWAGHHLLLVALLALLTSCGHAVLYGLPAKRDAAFISTAPIRLYLDRQGSLYPAAQDKLAVDNDQLKEFDGVLFDYYTLDTTPGSARDSVWKQLLACYQLPSAAITGSDNDQLRNVVWRTLQQKMRRRFIDQFNAHLAKAKPEMVVVLVHGYNNDVSAVAWYTTVERTIRQRLPDTRIQFVEIRWDGGASATALGIWGYAQHTMYPVGLALRQLLAGIDQPELPVRIMAHSTGCPLTCIALWNSTGALSGDGKLDIWGEDYQTVFKQATFATPTLTHLRVALLAPAMPYSHFNNFFDRTPADTTAPSRYERIVFGYNTHDQATGKWILPASVGGNTRLGVHPQDYCDYVLPEVQKRGNTRVYQVDFTAGMKQAGTRGAHGVADLMQDRPAFEALLDAWLTDAVPGSHLPMRTCQ